MPYLSRYPDFRSLFFDLAHSRVDLILRSDGMIYYDGFKIRHAKGSPDQLGLPYELSRDDRSERNPELFESNRIMETALAA